MENRHLSLGRRLLPAVAAALVALPGLAAHAQMAKQHVTLRLDWLYQGPNSGFMVAKSKGFYDAAGLDVDMGPGRGSGSTAQLVATKADMFGFADGYVVGNSVSKGLNVRMVAAIYRRNPTAVIFLKDSGIHAVKDLAGKSIGIVPGSTQFQQWPAFVKGCDLNASSIRKVSVDPAGATPALVTGKVDALASYVQGTVPGVEIRSKKQAGWVWYSDCGVTTVSNGIIAHRDLIEKDPALVGKFVAASLKGFLYAREHPDEAVAITKTFSQAIVPAITRRELEMSWATWVTPNTANKPLGWMSEKDWETTVSVLKEYGGVTAPLKAETLFTNRFVPEGKEYIPPQPK